MSQSGAERADGGASPPKATGAPGSQAAGLVGETISGRYKILSVLGEGGMGAVYLAEHTLMRKKVALKVLHPEMIKRPEVVARFEREAMAAAHIDHPHVATATDFGKLDDGSFFLVLEYIEGTSLRDTLIAAGGVGLGVERALDVARQIADALVRAHELKIVHRDLKPENVMLVKRAAGARPFVKVLDFGIAKVPVDHLGSTPLAPGQILTRAGAVFGTPEYMAPEQALGENVDFRADLYTLGVMLYEMLTGKLPFERSEDTVSLLARQIAETPPPPAVRAPAAHIPPAADALVMRLLEKNPADRFGSAAELVAALVAAGGSPPSSADVGDAAHPAPPSSAGMLAAAPSTPGMPSAPSAPSAPRIPTGPVSAPWSTADAHAKTSLPEAPSSSAARRSPTLQLHDRAESFASRIGLDLTALTRGLPEPVRKLAPAAIVAAALGALLLGGILLVAVGVRAIRGVGASASADAGEAAAAIESHSSPKLSEETIASASAGGPSALEALLAKFPDDARVLRELVRVYSQQGSHAEAMQTAVRLLAVAPRAASDETVLDAVTAAVQATNPDAVDLAVALCQRSLGERGPEILYDQSLRPGANKARFTEALLSADARSHASPALNVLVDLRTARSCDERKALLPRATSDGDARTLAQLEKMAKGRRCGFFGRGDCCIKKEDLDDAIDAVQARLGGASGTSATP